MMNLQYFCIFMYFFDGFINFWGCFFVESLPNPVAMPELSNWSASKAWQVLTTKTPNFNKRAACSHHCPHRHPAPSLGHWYTGVYLRIFDLGLSNPTTFLGLCSSGDYRQSKESPMDVPTFNSTEKSLTFTIYDCIPRIRPKNMCYLTKVSPFDVELI